MSERDRHEITQVPPDLHSERVDQRAAVDRLFEAVCGELRHLAFDLMRAERDDHTIESTALVHEAYFRLVDDSRIQWRNRVRFFGVAARAMRQVVVDYALKRARIKRGGDWRKVVLDDSFGLEDASIAEILDVEDALTRLAENDARVARIVKPRVFAGLTATEVAHVVGLSGQTVHEEWRAARMSLRNELAGEGES